MHDLPSVEWTASKLRAHAAECGIDLAGARRKADILAAIEASTATVLAGTEASLQYAIGARVLSSKQHAGPIQALLLFAKKIDLAGESVDSVTITRYLKCCDELGLLPGTTVGEVRAPGAKPKTPKADPEGSSDPAPNPTPMPQGQDRAARLSKLRGHHAG